jgi:hypothetical protein
MLRPMYEISRAAARTTNRQTDCTAFIATASRGRCCDFPLLNRDDLRSALGKRSIVTRNGQSPDTKSGAPQAVVLDDDLLEQAIEDPYQTGRCLVEIRVAYPIDRLPT